VDRRPVTGTLLRELARAGFESATVVVGHLGERVRALVGDGSGFGVSVCYAEQPSPDGSADALRRALGAGAQLPALVAASDTVFRPGDLTDAARRWIGSGYAAGIGVRRVPREELGERTPVRVEDGRAVGLGGEPGEGSLAAAPLWFLGESLAGRLEELPGPPFELAEAFRRAIAVGEPVAALELGPTRDLTRPHDLVTRNFPYLG
jgi:NDP-mannose synthase